MNENYYYVYILNECEECVQRKRIRSALHYSIKHVLKRIDAFQFDV